MTRIFLTACLVCLLATSAMTLGLTRSDGASAQLPVPTPPPLPVPGGAPPAAQQVVLAVGDTLRVDGAAMGCQVTMRGRRPVLECRRDGSLAGTYGAFMSDRTLTVARYRSRHTAQTILTARHGGRWRACGRAAQAGLAVSVSRGCR